MVNPRRFPKSLSYVILDMVEKIYLTGFVFLQLFIMLFPILSARSKHAVEEIACVPSDEVICPDVLDAPATDDSMAFLPLMVTSVYCAVGIVWGFIRLMFVYLNEETTYHILLLAVVFLARHCLVHELRVGTAHG